MEFKKNKKQKIKYIEARPALELLNNRNGVEPQKFETCDMYPIPTRCNHLQPIPYHHKRYKLKHYMK